MKTEQSAFCEPREILRDTQNKVEREKDAAESFDYFAFVPDGKPTLDINLDREIELLRPFGIGNAVIINSSLIWCQHVREGLMKADCMSLKMGSVREDAWHRIIRPAALCNWS